MGMNNSIDLARKTIVKDLKIVNLECTKNIYKNLLRLQMLQQIEDFSRFQFKYSEEMRNACVIKWDEQDRIVTNDFIYREPLLSQRASLLQTFGIVGTRELKKLKFEAHQNVLLNLMKEARNEGQLNIAIRNQLLLSSMESSKSFKGKLILEDAQLQWNTGDFYLAKRLVETIISNRDYEPTLCKIDALRLYGIFQNESQSANPIVIHQQYFDRALIHLEKFTNMKSKFLHLNKDVTEKEFDIFELESKIQIYDAIAMYADREYVQVIVIL